MSIRVRGKSKQVIDAAVEVFLLNGFDQTSMDAIAARAGVSKTTVYAHYADKLALFKAVVERSAQSLSVELGAGGSQEASVPEERLTKLILSVLQASTQPAFRAFLRVMVSESTRHPDLADAMRAAAPVDVLALITEALEQEASSQGYELRDARAHATLLLRMAASGPQLDSLLFVNFKPDHTLLEDHARSIVSIFLHGIEPRAGASAPAGSLNGSYGYPWLPDELEEPAQLTT